MNTINLRKSLKMTQQAFADFAGVSRRTIENWESSESCPAHVYGLLLEKIKGLSVTVVVAAVGDEYTRPIKVSAASRLDRDAAAAELATEFKRTTGRDLTPANAARFLESMAGNDMYAAIYSIRDIVEWAAENPADAALAGWDTDDAEAVIVNALNGEGGLAGYREVLTLTDAAAMLDAE